jgi:putative tricarboxylic transport membrane protein
LAPAVAKRTRTSHVEMALFGLAGYAFKKLDYPIAPLVLAMVIGDEAEDAFRQSMILSKGSLIIFWSNGIAGTLTMLVLILAFWPLIAGLSGLVRRPADITEARP